jgi:hypothetical protein
MLAAPARRCTLIARLRRAASVRPLYTLTGVSPVRHATTSDNAGALQSLGLRHLVLQRAQAPLRTCDEMVSVICHSSCLLAGASADCGVADDRSGNHFDPAADQLQGHRVE